MIPPSPFPVYACLSPTPFCFLFQLIGVRFRYGFEDMDMIFWIKLVHTLIFFVASACILYIVYCGISGKVNRYLWMAIGTIFAIGIIHAANGFECPLATLVYRLAGRNDVSDIFLPDWFARNIMPISTAIFVIGIVLIAGGEYRRRKALNNKCRRD